MNRCYLVQRARFNERVGREGIDALLSMDYMGSSEFEWGALPKALRSVRAKLLDGIDYQLYEVKLADEKIVQVYSAKEDVPDVKKAIVKMSGGRGQIVLKECSLLEKWINNSEYQTTDFWWDIGNDFFFWKKNEDFTSKFLEALITTTPVGQAKLKLREWNRSDLKNRFERKKLSKLLKINYKESFNI